MTNIPDAPARVAKLYKNFTFAGGAHLFEYKDQYHRLLFTKWNFFSDPSEDENNQALAERYREEVKKTVEELKKKQLGRIDPEDLPAFYEKTHGGGYRLGYRQKAELINLGKQHGAEKIRDKILAFFKSSKGAKIGIFFGEQWFYGLVDKDEHGWHLVDESGNIVSLRPGMKARLRF
ncbi:MAG: hypothetical protein ACUVSK_04195 [Desulfotomaculales bacterium]